MSKKRIAVGTSTGCLDIYEHKYNIPLLRITIVIEGKEYVDGIDIKPKEFYELLRDNPNVLPKTSQPSIGRILEFFEKYIEEGYNEFFVSTISSKLSGTFNGVVQAAEILKDRATFHLIDTKTVCFNEGYFSLEAARMIEENKTSEEIVKHLEEIRDNQTIFFGVNSLEFLVKNGRLSGAAGFIGKILSIKPLLQVTSEGYIESIEKIRSTKKSLDAVCHKVNEYIGNRKARCFLIYTGQSSNQDYFIERLKEICNLENLEEIGCSAAVGSHVGGDIIGIGIIIEKS